ncbi:MmcQ/YjbR family DNA-binding protein [Fibrisoma montanum]|uniref:MmcQ/YjbR family DNA-binding protein n=1 Tax=Fibrisoma montanum TaxID=2305895 RepID=A0A418M4E3_9BACT|nr:MmcQ/YjbR family DNA-binding protein [Fibrisoma montanum]RIV20642.1 MmcQ/YjbR family DNA-binding protein [Fibrisoma montanum]
MNSESIRDYCIAKPGVTESFPFDEVTLVFKVSGKIFALLSLDNQPLTLALKCDPERALQLRDMFPAVRPGYHMNKMHWNTITLDGTVRTNQIQEWIDHSYELVKKGLPKAVREQLN